MSADPNWENLKEIFHAAVVLPAHERAAYLNKVCDGDLSLRQAVESLLKSHEESGNFVDAPAYQAAANVLIDGVEFKAGQMVAQYKILSLLGEGGMGRVYLAEDTKLNRKVALKVLPVLKGDDLAARKRLLREARAAAALDHPNICAIYEVGEAFGQSYIAMQYVEGDSLEARIKKTRLSIEDAINIAIQVADALSTAHARNMIHRDIKPANLMLTNRGVKVLDFGLAKLMSDGIGSTAEAETKSLLTQPGLIIGTVPYMSPEQVRGERLDARTDIFSFGVVIYEMVTGSQPFANPSAAATAAAILTHEPPPMTRYCTDVPNELQRVVRKCLEKDRERRYQTIREVALDLESCRDEFTAQHARASRAKWTGAVTTTPSNLSKRQSLISGRALIAGALLAALLGVALAYGFFFRRATTPALRPEIKSLAVLPLNNLSGDPSQEYFADGMTEALISNLAQIRALKVIPRTSAMRYKGSNKSLAEIARELNVDALIEGSVQRSGGRVQVTARLIPAAAESLLWSRDYDRDLSDILKLQSEVARAIADEIRIQVTPDERARLTTARSVNPQAHDAYLRGRSYIKRNEDDLSQAIQYFERAIQLAPDYAAAHAGLSDAWLQRGIWGAKQFREVEPPARAAALKAVELDPQLAEARASLSRIKYLYDWDWTGAEQELKRALELDPGSLYTHSYYADLLMSLGRHAEAIDEIRRVEQLDPLSSETQSSFGRILYRSRKYDEATLHLKRALELEPRNYSAYVRLGDVYAKLGRYDDAITVFEKAAQLRSDGKHAARIARVYALMGRKHEARQMLIEIKEGPFEIAGVYAALGDLDEAFRILLKAVEERNSLLVYLKEDPSFDNLHSDPRWQDLLRRMNFPLE
jgi:eukaryotic-like serine/threonine-protein kinase